MKSEAQTAAAAPAADVATPDAEAPDAEALYARLLDAVRRLVGSDDSAVVVGIWTGGAWLAERLQADLGLDARAGVISSALHRDDFGQRGLASGTDATRLPFGIDGRRIVLVDDVLYTGRTVRAVLNELFDFGRPASVELMVLVDRGGRQLPIAPGFAAATILLAPTHGLRLQRADDGRLSLVVEPRRG